MKHTKKLLAVVLAVVMLAATGVTALAATQTIELPTGNLMGSSLSFSNVISHHEGYTENDLFDFEPLGDSGVYVTGEYHLTGGALYQKIYTVRVANSTSIVYKNPSPDIEWSRDSTIEVHYNRSGLLPYGAVTLGLEFADLPARRGSTAATASLDSTITRKAVFSPELCVGTTRYTPGSLI